MPTEFTAATLNVYAFPLVSPVTVALVEVPPTTNFAEPATPASSGWT